MADLLHEITADDTSHVTAIAYNEDGSVMASSGFDSTIKLWETAGYSETARLEGHANCANALLFISRAQSGAVASGARPGAQPRPAQLVSTSSDATVRFWNLATGEEEKRFKPHSQPIVGLAYLTGLSLLATSSYDGTIRFIDFERGEEAGRVRGKGREVGHLVFIEDDGVLVTGGISPDITFWSVPDGEPLGRVRAHNGGTAAMKPLSDKRTLITIGFDGEIKKWKRTGEAVDWRDELLCKMTHKGYYFAGLSPSGRFLAVSVVRGILMIDIRTGETIDEIKVKPKSLYSPRFHPDGKTLAAGAADKKIRIWKID